MLTQCLFIIDFAIYYFIIYVQYYYTARRTFRPHEKQAIIGAVITRYCTIIIPNGNSRRRLKIRTIA